MNAEYEIRDHTVTTRELAVQTPLDWKNFGWVVHQLEQRLKEAGRAQFDDACTVTVGDDEIIFSWQLSDETSKPAFQ